MNATCLESWFVQGKHEAGVVKIPEQLQEQVQQEETGKVKGGVTGGFPLQEVGDNTYK